MCMSFRQCAKKERLCGSASCIQRPTQLVLTPLSGALVIQAMSDVQDMDVDLNNGHVGNEDRSSSLG